jgi:mannose-6-phosphate isomerase-like protein (cupin superfamily)
MITKQTSPFKSVDKAWGWEEWLVQSEFYCAKYLYVMAGRKSSLHFHRKRDETLRVEWGELHVQLAINVPFDLRPQPWFEETIVATGESVRISAGRVHRFWATPLRSPESYGAKILEISTYQDETDIVRLEPAQRWV